jgi:hypothetical protein
MLCPKNPEAKKLKVVNFPSALVNLSEGLDTSKRKKSSLS